MLALLASLALLAGACAKAEVQTGTGPDAGSESGGAAPAAPAARAADALPEPPPPAKTHPPPTSDPPEMTPAPPDPPAPPATDAPDTAPTTTGATSPEPIEPPESPDPPEPPPTSQPPDEAPTTTTASGEAPAAGDGESPAAPESLPGEPYEYGPAEGTLLTVVGVPHDEVLNVHDVPSGQIIATLDISNPYESQLKVREAPSGEVIASFDSPTGGIVATGRTRRLPGAAWREAVWNEVSVAGLTGWARAAYLAPIGLSDDLTAHLIDVLGERPVADTLIELALIVGETMASDEPPSRVIVVTRPIVFEALGEVTVDVLNIGDDSLLGFRLLVFATPGAEDWMSDDPGPFTLRTVERTILCYSDRGVTAGGLCV